MFYALPAETVYEAKQHSRRQTIWLFSILILLYVFFIDLMVFVVAKVLQSSSQPTTSFPQSAPMNPPALPPHFMVTWLFFSTLTAIVIAIIHFGIARAKSLDDLLAQLNAKPADPGDPNQATFIDVVHELEAATGLKNVQPIVLFNAGYNAFSIQDGHHQAAIGVTDGLLRKLNRNELESVIAHEAAHLIHEDSRLTTTACFLFSVFGSLSTGLGEAFAVEEYATFPSSNSNDENAGWVLLILWIISLLGYFLTKIVFLTISREREYFADADAVQMCKNPFALAESLYKISDQYRGGQDVRTNTYSALFMMNPQDSLRDEQEDPLSDLLSTHPPVQKRLERLLTWAKSDLSHLKAAVDQEEQQEATTQAENSSNLKKYYAYQNNQWVGPYTSGQLQGFGWFAPSSWICAVGSQQVMKASDQMQLFLQNASKNLTTAAQEIQCPRCKLPLKPYAYAGLSILQCEHCQGYFFKPTVFEKILAQWNPQWVSDASKTPADLWKNSEKGTTGAVNHFSRPQCSLCQTPMVKNIYQLQQRIIVNRCPKDFAIWLDRGELETFQSWFQRLPNKSNDLPPRKP
jgi:heat shock protein HtpX